MRLGEGGVVGEDWFMGGLEGKRLMSVLTAR
jgi:hypothetical protein